MTLVIGYGNELRRDDGVGPCIARAVADWGLPDVCALAVHQLTPELAEALAGAREVFFVDAAAGADVAVQVHPVPPDAGSLPLGHISSAAELLALAEALYGRRPRAWLVSVPARDFDFGEGLSPTAARGMELVVRWLRRHVAAEAAGG
jgi:hydrogenase maturation protease